MLLRAETMVATKPRSKRMQHLAVRKILLQGKDLLSFSSATAAEVLKYVYKLVLFTETVALKVKQSILPIGYRRIKDIIDDSVENFFGKLVLNVGNVEIVGKIFIKRRFCL